jgi:hypothetical protein
MNTFTLPVVTIDRSIAPPADSTPTLASTHSHVRTRADGQPTSHCSPYTHYRNSFQDSKSFAALQQGLPNGMHICDMLRQHLRQMFIFIRHHPDTNVTYAMARTLRPLCLR